MTLFLEKLQQLFISLTLQSEQEEYALEGIQWTPISYFDNKIVVDLIESKRPPGIMSILDDVCFTMHAVTEGADQQFCGKVGGGVSNPHFSVTSTSFCVKHYAGDVIYNVDGFVESNKDTLFKDLILCMQNSQSPFIKDLFPDVVGEKTRPTTASVKIRGQSADLISTLMKCVPSYVRCIKPNDLKRAGEFDGERVLHQVRYLNLKENVKVRRAGFCYRSPFEKVLKRYAILSKETFPTWKGDVRVGVEHLMQKANMAKEQYQLGKTKLFIKAPESLLLLEELRERKYDGYARVIQRAWRLHASRRRFVQLKTVSDGIFFNKKERNRFSLNRGYMGDYIGFHDDVILRSLIQEEVVFACDVKKYDRKYRVDVRPLILTKQSVIIVGEVKNRGSVVQVIKRRIPIELMAGISLSTHSDDFLVLHCPEYDTFCECVFKTELVTVLVDLYREKTGRVLQINFCDKYVFF